MRQFGHSAIGAGFWLLLVLLWVMLVRGHKASPGHIAYSVQYLAAVSGAVLAVTFWWIRHNTGIYQRKGPRTGRPEMPPRTDEDRLGRPIRWETGDAIAAGHLIVDFDGPAKVYVEAG